MLSQVFLRRIFMSRWLSKESINSEIFWQYLEHTIIQHHETRSESKNLFLFVTDNATIHKTNKASKILNSNEIGLLTIKPYSPWLNPVEGYISSIKKKIRKKLDKNRILTELLIKNWIKDASVGDQERFVDASRKETMKLIRKIKYIQ